MSGACSPPPAAPEHTRLSDAFLSGVGRLAAPRQPEPQPSSVGVADSIVLGSQQEPLLDLAFQKAQLLINTRLPAKAVVCSALPEKSRTVSGASPFV